MELNHSSLRTVSLMAVAIGFLSFVVGSSVIALFGYTYIQPKDSFFGPIRNAITPAYWVGTSIIIFGIFAFVGGIVGTILYFLKNH